MPDILDFLTGGPPDLGRSLDDFHSQNLSAPDIFSMGNTIPRTVGGLPGGSIIPGIGSTPLPGLGSIDKVLGPLNSMRFGMNGTWESTPYGDDLNAHHPKLKFLFKVGFYGFVGRDFYYYVQRADKPRVKFNHVDVNYYNFRTRVLTSVTYEPMSITFFDEIGNTLNDFFVRYLKQRSGQGSGNYGIDKGFSTASSSYPYSNGYSETHGQCIIVEQIFGNGTQSNRYIFKNPRIETFDFDELNMEESSMGSHATITFSYDAIECITVYGSTIHSWGNVDMLRGGINNRNAGATSGVMSSLTGQVSANGFGIPGNIPMSGGNSIVNMAQASGNMSPNYMNSIFREDSSRGAPMRSSSDTISQGIQGTLQSISSGANMIFGGKEKGYQDNDGAWNGQNSLNVTGQYQENDGSYTDRSYLENDGGWST